MSSALSDADDSGMASDTSTTDPDGDHGTELCQLGDHHFPLPLDLYGLPDLTAILSFETWNSVLSEADRFALAAFLPDLLDQPTFAHTLSHLFSAANFHFGSPLNQIFDKLKGGQFEPTVELYSRGRNFLQRRRHYHFLRKYQDAMVGRLFGIRDAWEGCSGYNVRERLRLLRSRRRHGRLRQFGSDEFAAAAAAAATETDSEEDERSSEGFWSRRWKNGSRFDRENPRRILKVAAASRLHTPPHCANGFEVGSVRKSCYQVKDVLDDDEYYLAEQSDEVGMHVDRNAAGEVSSLKPGRKKDLPIRDERGHRSGFSIGDYDGFSNSQRSRHAVPEVNISSDGRNSRDTVKKARHPEKDRGHHVEDQNRHRLEYEEGDIASNRANIKTAFDSKVRYNKSYTEQVGNSHFHYDPRATIPEEKIRNKSVQKRGRDMEHSRGDIVLDQNEETESDSSDQVEPDPTFRKSDYMCDQSAHMEARKDALHPTSRLLDVKLLAKGSENRGHSADVHSVKADIPEESNMPRSGRASISKKGKGKVDSTYEDELDKPAYLQSTPKMKIDHSDCMRKKTKWNADSPTDFLAVESPDAIISEKRVANIEREEVPVKKPFTPITPTIHTGFSFSIIHLLSAVRKAMIAGETEDTMELWDHLKKDGMYAFKREACERQHSQSSENMDEDSSDHAGKHNLPSLTVDEIVNRVRLNPGDPCILETQEPLHDLVRGVLKIFSSRTAPLGAKGWKALVVYEKSHKRWSWIGPVSSSLFSNDTVEEETSSEAWDIPHKMLVKIVDAFANWLKSGQEILKQIGSLPPPPMSMLQNLDEKERFRDLKTQKCPNTISPSSDEARAYFRREEVLRYSIPDRAFSYTAADRKKSTVAPLRRGGGKPTSKARDHFMLKIDRPPHVTILCLVRDAAARLPGSIGTRADVCTLIRDSQFIADDVSDAQVNQIVSGALDRLHYERDPCVQFDGERKLWVYLHTDREEEDFEDDGTTSKKKWKKPRKDPMPHSDSRGMNDVNLHEDGDADLVGYSAEYGFNLDPSIDSTSIHAQQKNEPLGNVLRHSIKNIGPFIDSAGRKSRGIPVIRQSFRSNPFRESKILCQENSTMEVFDDDQFSRERTAGHLGARYL